MGVQAVNGPSWNQPLIVRECVRVRTEGAKFRRPTRLAAPDAVQPPETDSPARDPGRSPVALAFGGVALRNTPLTLKLLLGRADVKEAALLLRDAFDMLEEDYEEESFFATVRKSYWQAAEGSAARNLGQALIDKLEF